jgi:hypothetical protein
MLSTLFVIDVPRKVGATKHRITTHFLILTRGGTGGANVIFFKINLSVGPLVYQSGLKMLASKSYFCTRED